MLFPLLHKLASSNKKKKKTRKKPRKLKYFFIITYKNAIKACFSHQIQKHTKKNVV